MELVSTYSVKIKNHNRIFRDTVRLYREAVAFFLDVINGEWASFLTVKTQKEAVNLTEAFTVRTAKRPLVKYDFGKDFYKFPSYLRRAAIAEAYGKVCSYRSSLSNWEKADRRTRGQCPSVPKAGFVYPAMYKDNCYERTGEYRAKVKIFLRNTWDWLDIEFNKGDADYIKRRCSDRKECVPTFRKRGKEWFLDFPFKMAVQLNDTDIHDQTVIAVDLGLRSCCTCVAMRASGAVAGRHFLKLPAEYDSLARKLSHLKRAQRHGSRDVSVLWKAADGVNRDIAVKTSQFIMDVAVLYSADVIVFEHLELKGKKKGSKKQRLHLWRARYVQAMVTGKAHMAGMRISRINAWGTSRLAFDGSGRVKRGTESEKTGGCYSLCEFESGKVYHCDLNAALNIGARYFVREITKTLPVTEGQRIAAKVPGCAKRSTCTLSTLIRLHAELHAAA